MIPDAVIIATVLDPCAIFRTAETPKPTSISTRPGLAGRPSRRRRRRRRPRSRRRSRPAGASRRRHRRAAVIRMMTPALINDCSTMFASSSRLGPPLADQEQHARRPPRAGAPGSGRRPASAKSDADRRGVSQTCRRRTASGYSSSRVRRLARSTWAPPFRDRFPSREGPRRFAADEDPLVQRRRPAATVSSRSTSVSSALSRARGESGSRSPRASGRDEARRGRARRRSTIRAACSASA